VLVYPNPMDNELTIQVNNPLGQFQFEFYNSVGQLMLKGELEASKTLNLTDFTKGVYFLKLINAKGIETVQKVIKN